MPIMRSTHSTLASVVLNTVAFTSPIVLFPAILTAGYYAQIIPLAFYFFHAHPFFKLAIDVDISSAYAGQPLFTHQLYAFFAASSIASFHGEFGADTLGCELMLPLFFIVAPYLKNTKAHRHSHCHQRSTQPRNFHSVVNRHDDPYTTVLPQNTPHCIEKLTLALRSVQAVDSGRLLRQTL